MAYDQEIGELRWKSRADRNASWNTRFAGEIAGSVLSNGYRYINFGGRLCLAHMVIRFYMTGEWPTDQTDHRNRHRAANEWANIRPANPSGNAINQKIRSTNRSGVKGVSWDKRKNLWVATITKDRTQRFLGYHATIAGATQARRDAEIEYHGDFAPQGVS